MDQIKEAFNKVKQDISEIQTEIKFLREGLIETRENIIYFCGILKQLQLSQDKIIDKFFQLNKKEHYPIEKTIDKNPTNQHINPTNQHINPTNQHINLEKNTKDPPFSIGNEGVPTDRQTDRQTDKNKEIIKKIEKNTVDNAVEMLDSLDSLKKELRLKFKRLTTQEMLIFTTIYQIEEEGGVSDYRTLANKLSLTESSVRDYIGKLIKKEIPIEKNKINNKTIIISISENLKKIVSLSTILTLREI